MGKPFSPSGVEKPTLFQLVILVLSIYVLGALLVQTLLPLSQEMNRLLDAIDTLICVVFIYDFFARLYYAKDKGAFLKWNWIDLAGSIPLIEPLRLGRIPRVIRLLRVLRAVRSSKVVIAHLFRNRGESTLASVGVMAFILLIFSAIAILHFETEPNCNIKTAEDALWWAFVTLATVGYGDKYPVTIEGKIVAAMLITTGVGIFSTLTAFVASTFVAPEQRREAAVMEKLSKEVELLRKEIESLKTRGN